MTLREITPVGKVLDEVINVPGSKSITNRALMCAALAKGESVIRNVSDSDDTAMMVNGLNQLGVLVRKQSDALIVEGTGGRLYAPKFPIPVGNAGTTLRFLLGLAALAKGTTTLDADPRMAERPNDEIREALSQLGIEVRQGGSRFVVRGGTIVGDRVRVRAETSSQYVSSLLMAAPYASTSIALHLEGNVSSSPYIDMTVQVMKHFGVEARRSSSEMFTVQAGQRYVPATLTVEADASSASYFLAAAALCRGRIVVRGLRVSSQQGDSKFADVLKAMGCSVREVPEGVECSSGGTLSGVNVDMNSMPDAVPTLAVVALFANSPTRIHNIAHLRYKESDRLSALESELRKLGANVTAEDDALEIVPTPLHGARLDTHNDHRLAMSFALVGLKVPGVMIENPECVRKSFPRFWDEFQKLTPANHASSVQHQNNARQYIR